MADEVAHDPQAWRAGPMRDLPSEVAEGSIFRALFFAYPDSLLVVDRSGRILLANPSAAALLGYSEAELLTLNVDALVPDGIRPRHAADREAYGRAPRPRPMGTHTELMAKRKDGGVVMVEIALSPVQDRGQLFIVAAIRDIGVYPRVRQALRRARYSEHLAQLGRLAVDTRDLQNMLRHVPEIMAAALQVEVAAVWLLDRDRRDFQIASGVGAVAGEEIGARVANDPGTPAGYLCARGEPVLTADYATEDRFPVPRACLDASLRSAIAVPLNDMGRVTGLLLARSTTPGRFGDEEVRFLEALSSLLVTSLQRVQTEEELHHARRLESVGRLTGGIAHDFNNLLTVIQGNLQVLQELPELVHDAQARQLLGAATRASRRGAELTGKLLAFSRRQVLQPVAVDTQALLHSLAGMLRRTLDQRIRIEIEAAPQRLHVRADPGQLESALLNIAINARDAMPEGGTLRFASRIRDALPAAPREDRHGGDRAAASGGGFVALSISDSGIGMPEAVRERAFEPFFTTKETGRGTGLGLSTVHGFASQSQGSVAIDSEPGRGTTVTLYLPRADPEGAGDGVAPGPARPEPVLPPGLRVLLVEDDAEVRAVIETFLHQLDCRVLAVATAEQALPALDRAAPPFDLLLSDIALGAGLRGTGLADEAQRRRPALAVLLMSGYSPALEGGERSTGRRREVLRKPCTRSALARAMANALAGHA